MIFNYIGPYLKMDGELKKINLINENSRGVLNERDSDINSYSLYFPP